MTAASDKEILERIAGGDRAALAALYDRHAGTLNAVVLRVVKSPSDAEDCLQDIWLEVWRRADRYREHRGPVIAWLLTLARSRAIDRYRSRSSRQRTEDKAPPPEPHRTDDPGTQTELNQVRDRVRSALDGLEEHHRRVLELAYWKGMSQSEIAQEVDAPLGTVKSWIRQSLTRLQAQLPKEDWS